MKNLMSDDDRLPATFDEWLSLTTARNEQLRAGGHEIIEVEVRSDGFAAYCAASGLQRNIDTLGAYTVAKRYREEQGMSPI
jgi:hypothetical protein